MNSPERGDSRPCAHRECGGVMQFGREPQQVRDGIAMPQGPLVWICRSEPKHVIAKWDDDGGGPKC